MESDSKEKKIFKVRWQPEGEFQIERNSERGLKKERGGLERERGKRKD